MKHTKEDIEAAIEEVSLMLELDKKTGINNPDIADGRRKFQIILAALEAYKPDNADMQKRIEELERCCSCQEILDSSE